MKNRIINTNSKKWGNGRSGAKLMLSAIILLCVLYTHGLAQPNQTVSGQVIDAGSEKALPLKSILQLLEEHYDVTFLYKGGLVNNKMVTNPDIHIGDSDKTDKQLSNIIDKLGLKLHRVNETSYIVLPKPYDGKFKKQVQTVSGTVTDASTGETMPGVNIILKGTTTGTSTDMDGKYEMGVPSLQDTLMFSFIGYQTKEVPINGRTQIDVALQPQAVSGENLVVVGYGRKSERNVTGSISSVNVAEVNKNLPNTNLSQSFSSVPGIVFKESGRPGQGGNLLIRGQNSLSANNDPLIVLDGIIFNGDISDIDPQNIASMQVLKDASSTAIYGSRAANGVILVTSKEGTGKKPTVNFDFSQSFSEEDNLLNLISPERYLQRRLDWRRQSGLDADPNRIAEFLAPDEAENLNAGITNRPWDVASRTGKLTTAHVSIAGGSDNTSYLVSSNYSIDKGLLINDKEERINLRGNLDIDVKDWVRVGTRTMFTNRDRSGLPASFNDIFRNSPFGTFFHPDGEPRQFPVTSERASVNAVYESLLTTNNENFNNLFSNFYAILTKPVLNGNLSYRVNFSPNLRWDKNFNSMRQDIHREENTTSASKFNRNTWEWNLENFLTYEGQLGEDHSFETTLLFSRRHRETELTDVSSGRLELPGLGFNNLSLGSTPMLSSSKVQEEMVSYMGRLNYQFKDRYLFTITVRRDGSSVFAENNKYANLPSGAFAWIVSDESFMKNNLINFLKLRVSVGKVGNEAIQPLQSKTLDETTRFVFGSNNPLGVITSDLGNPDLKWETTKTTNVGIDFELSEGRFGGTLEFYNSNTSDLLVRRSLPITGGFESILTNIGKVNNKGIEISLHSDNIQKSNFVWSTSFSGSYNRNRIKNLFGTDVNNDGKEDDVISNNWFIGQPINSFFDLVFDGIWQEDDPNIMPGFQPGDVKIKDINGDGVINADDRQIIGSGQDPKFQLSLTNQFNYKNFDLSITMNAMLDWLGSYQLMQPLVPGRAFGGIDNNWWTAENRSNSRPSLVWQNAKDINFYFGRDFLRIQDVSLSYTFDNGTLNKIGLNSLRLYISAKNLHSFNSWPGSDPESATDISTNQGPGQNGAFPVSQSITFGLHMGI